MHLDDLIAECIEKARQHCHRDRGWFAQGSERRVPLDRSERERYIIDYRREVALS
jgi:hypothetical protein